MNFINSSNTEFATTVEVAMAQIFVVSKKVAYLRQARQALSFKMFYNSFILFYKYLG